MQEELDSPTFIRTIMRLIMCKPYTYSCVRFKIAGLKVLILLSPDHRDHCLYSVSLRWFTCPLQRCFLHVAEQHCLLSVKGRHDGGIRAWCQHSGHFKS